MFIDLPSQTHSKLLEILDKPKWLQGGRLPPETELAREIGVSRPVLRKALARLREEGRIFSRRGSGNYVQPKMMLDTPVVDFGNLAIKTVHDMKRCMRFRQVVECAAAGDAAIARDMMAIRAVEAAHAALVEMPAGQNVFDYDFAFHLAVATASCNPYYCFVLETLRQQIALGHEFSRKLRGLSPTELSERVLLEHGRILDAIRAADPDAARQAMEQHLQQGIARLFGEAD